MNPSRLGLRAVGTTLGLSAALGSFFLVGCFGDDDSSADSPQVKAGNASMNGAIANMTSSDYKYGEEDLSDLQAAHAAYASALKQDPKNAEANFGAAMTEVLLAVQSEKVADLINRTMDAPSPFDTRLVDEASSKQAVLMKKAAELAETYPEFHEVQDALAQEVLPAMDKAISHLNSAYQDPNFSMTLTLDDRAREIDHAEAGVVLAGVKVLQGLLTLFLSYDIDFDEGGTYAWVDDLGTIQNIEGFDTLTAAQSAALRKAKTLLDPASPFLAVRPAWKVRLAAVHGNIGDAVSIARSALASIRTEGDAQNDDLLRLCTPLVSSECIEDEDLTSVLEVLDTVKKYVHQPYALEIAELDTTLSIDFSAYLRIEDYKKMLPHYAFYPESEWSAEKPLFYFTDAAGENTGDLNDIEALEDLYEADILDAGSYVDELQKIIHFQDPTFQGYLPGATQASLWNLIRKSALESESNEEEIVDDGGFSIDTNFVDTDPGPGADTTDISSPLLKLGRRTMDPKFILETSLR